MYYYKFFRKYVIPYLYGIRTILRLFDGTVEDITSPFETKHDPEFDQASPVSEDCHADVNIIPICNILLGIMKDKFDKIFWMAFGH